MIITARIRRMGEGIIFSLFVSPHQGVAQSQVFSQLSGSRSFWGYPSPRFFPRSLVVGPFQWGYPSSRFFPRSLVPGPLQVVPHNWPGVPQEKGTPLARTGIPPGQVTLPAVWLVLFQAGGLSCVHIYDWGHPHLQRGKSWDVKGQWIGAPKFNYKELLSKHRQKSHCVVDVHLLARCYVHNNVSCKLIIKLPKTSLHHFPENH